MLTEIKRQLRLFSKTFALFGGGIIFFAILIQAIQAVFPNSGTVFESWGQIIILSLLPFAVFFICLHAMRLQAALCLTFGALRRYLFPAIGLCIFLFGLVMLALNAVWYYVDNFIATLFGAYTTPLFIITQQIPIWVAPVVLLAVTICGTWVGTLWFVYSSRYLQLLSIIWMAAILFISNLNRIWQAFLPGVAIPFTALGVIAAVLVLLMLGHSIYLQRRIAVQI